MDSWIGHSDQPTYEVASEIGETLIASFVAGTEAAERVGDADEQRRRCPRSTRCTSCSRASGRCWCRSRPTSGCSRSRSSRARRSPTEDQVLPLFEFEPNAAEVLDELLPKYVQSRIYFALLQAAASELAARQKAMKSATDNAEELIKKYTRIANQARQAGITQEISEIVGGVNALADANAGSE